MLLSRMSLKETGIPARFVFTLLGFWGLFNAYAMRTNLSVAIVAMTKRVVDRSVNNSSTAVACVELISNVTGSSTNLEVEEGEFAWDPRTQALILGSFFYGYVITQFPGGVMTEKFGAKRLFGMGILLTSIFTLLTPVAARMGATALVIVRVIEGLAEGVTLPAMHSLIGKWIPQNERSCLLAFINTGIPTGTVSSMVISGILSASTFLGGWPSTFYIFGSLGCIWFVLWSLLIYETPSEHPRISASELSYIQKNQKVTKEVGPVPWKSILTCYNLWALCLTGFGHAWGFYTLLTEMPTYLNNVLHFGITQNGMLSSIPFIAQAVVACLAGFLADKVISQTNLTITTVRKIHNSIGFFGTGLFILSTKFLGCRPYLVVTTLSVAMGINGFVFSGYIATLVDISPRYAGIVMGMSCTVANLTGFLAPAVVSWVVGDEQSMENWGTIFIISSIMYFVFGAVFNLFCTSETQNWGASVDDEHPKTEHLELRTTDDVSLKPPEN